MFKIAVTGHLNVEKANNDDLVDFRKYNDDTFKKVYSEIEFVMNETLKKLSINKEDLILYSGMARGVDEIVALYAIDNNIKLFAAVPYTINWHKSRKESAIEYDKILEYAKKTAGYKEIKKGYKNTLNSYFARNQYMVDESNIVISYLKYYSTGSMDTIKRAAKAEKYYGNISELLKDNEKNELYERARQIVLKESNGSCSYLQRTLKVGWNTASKIIDELEDNGYISKMNSQGKRKV